MSSNKISLAFGGLGSFLFSFFGLVLAFGLFSGTTATGFSLLAFRSQLTVLANCLRVLSTFFSFSRTKHYAHSKYLTKSNDNVTAVKMTKKQRHENFFLTVHVAIHWWAPLNCIVFLLSRTQAQYELQIFEKQNIFGMYWCIFSILMMFLVCFSHGFG